HIPLELLAGGELDVSYLAGLDEQALRRFSLAGGGRYVLVEFPYGGWPRALEGAISRLRALGLTALVAHPERNPQVQERPERAGALVEAGALVQVTAASLVGRYGRQSQSAARRLLELGLVHVLASDAHSAGHGETGLRAAAAELEDELAPDLPAEAAAGVG